MQHLEQMFTRPALCSSVRNIWKLLENVLSTLVCLLAKFLIC